MPPTVPGAANPPPAWCELGAELVLGQCHQLVERLGRALVAAEQDDLVVLVGLVVEADDGDPGRDLVAIGDASVCIVGRDDVERRGTAVVRHPLQQLAVGLDERRRRRPVGRGVGEHVGQRPGDLFGHDGLGGLDRRTDGRRVVSVERRLEGDVGGAIVAATAAAGRGAGAGHRRRDQSGARGPDRQCGDQLPSVHVCSFPCVVNVVVSATICRRQSARTATLGHRRGVCRH